MIHRTPITVRFYELDPYGHLNHSVYIQYFEVGRIDLFASFGWTLGGLAELGTQVVVSSITTNFLTPGVEGDQLVVESWVEDVKRVTTTFGQRILRGDIVLAEQTVIGACLNEHGRPMRFPAVMTEAMRTAMADSE
jgi:acyl-CoA thioester hydrolase